jgi:hypothetical protein
MATIERFEDIISWKEARKLNQILGKLIDDGKLKKELQVD